MRPRLAGEPDVCRRLRTARNRSMFREINERIRSNVQPNGIGARQGPHPFVCECERPDCDVELVLELDEYEHVRGGLDRFAVLPDHLDAEERVLERHDGYLVVIPEAAAALSQPGGAGSW